MGAPVRRGARILASLALVAYAWWATGLAPFSASAYAAVFAVVGLGVGLAWRPSAVESLTTPATAWPWAVVLAVAIVLEVVGLVLGGRSVDVPTLSTTVDHLLRWHASRVVAFVIWAGVGLAPSVRRGPVRGRT